MKQFEVLKGRPEGFKQDHWFVVLSGEERCVAKQKLVVQALLTDAKSGKTFVFAEGEAEARGRAPAGV